MSQATMDSFGLKPPDHLSGKAIVPRVRIDFGGRSIEGPVWVQPGQADNTIALALGHGRQRTGRIGRGSGYNAYALRTSSAPYFAVGAKLTRVPGATQDI